MTATASEFRYFNERKTEREKKFGMTKLQLVGDDDEAPKDPKAKTLAKRAEEKELSDLSKYQHACFGSTLWRKNKNDEDESLVRVRVLWTV